MLTFVLAFSSLRVDYLYAGEITMAEPPSKAASAVESPSAEGLPAAAGENTQTEFDDGSQAVAPEPKGESAGKASSVSSEDEAQVLDTADKSRAEQPADAPEAVAPETGRAPAPLPAPEAASPFSPFSLEGPSPSGSLLTASGETSDAAFLAACSSGEAKLSLALEASGARFEAARAALQARYSGDLTFEVWDMQLKAGGADLPLPEGSSVGLKFMRYVDGYGMPGFAGLGESPKFFLLGADGSLTEVAPGASGPCPGVGYTDEFSFDGLVTLVALNGDNLSEIPSTTLEAGNYSITANLYVVAADAPIGAKAYMTTAKFPPLVPESDNARLTVGADGSLTLTLYVSNEVFTLQDATSGEKIKVLGAERGGASSSYGAHADRITKLVLSLDNATDSTFALGSCTQCPTVFGGGADQHWRMCVDVDFASMKKGGSTVDPGQDTFSKTYTDAVTGITVAVSTQDAGLAARLGAAELAVAEHNREDDTYQTAAKAFSKTFLSTPTMELYSIALLDADGSEISVDGSNVMVTIPTGIRYIDSYRVQEDLLVTLSSFKQGGNVLISDSSLGIFAVVEQNSAYYWVDFDFSDESTGVSGKMKVASEQTGVEGYKGHLIFQTGKEPSEFGDAYTFSLQMHFPPQDKELKVWWNDNTPASLSFSLPAGSHGKSVALVRTDGSTTSLTHLPSSVKDGKISFALLPSSSWIGKWEATKLLSDLHNGWKNGIGSASATAPVAYFVVLDSDSTIASDPRVAGNLVYNAADQTGIAFDEATCELVGGMISAKNAGTYTASFKPKDGYTWADGTTADKELTWNIKKKYLSWEDNEYLKYGEVPTFTSTVKGLEGDDTPESVGIKPKYIKESSRPAVVEPGVSYNFRYSDMVNWDQDPSFDNYYFGPPCAGCENYRVFIQKPTFIEMPAAATDLVYNGKRQVGVAKSEGYALEGAIATNAGDYVATVTPELGYAWSDGGREPVPVRWSIAKAPLTAKAKDVTVARGDELKLEAEVTGFKGGETAETAAGYAAPTVSLPAGVTADGLEPGRTYELGVSGGSAKNYEFTRYEKGTLTVAAAGPKPDGLAPGTYAVTANLAMSGAYNPAIPGLTVYANSPDNPFGPTIDENDPAEVRRAVPREPQSMNATLVMGPDGARHLLLPIKNPIFTTQSLGTCAELPDVRVERVAPTAGGGEWSGSYNKRADRIHKALIRLPGSQSSGVGSYDFAGSVLYAVPLDMEIAPAGPVALQLTVDYGSARRTSDSTKIPGLNGSEQGGDDPAPQPQPDPNVKPQPDPNQGGGTQPGTPGNPNVPADPGAKPSQPTDPSRPDRIAAGTYTVSANIWVDKATSGLPLQPHFTNASFPPMNPVAKNATLRVESDGHAYLTVPIVIQARIMQVLSISGLDIVSSERDGAGLSSITVDMGILSPSDTVVTKYCTASVRLGDLASTIIGGERNRTWNAVFQMNFSGLPQSGGGTVPEAARRLMEGQGADGTAEDAGSKAQRAEEAALAALGSGGANASAGKTLGGKGASADPDADAASEGGLSPFLPAIALAALAALGVLGWFLASGRHRRKQPSDEGGVR